MRAQAQRAHDACAAREGQLVLRFKAGALRLRAQSIWEAGDTWCVPRLSALTMPVQQGKGLWLSDSKAGALHLSACSVWEAGSPGCLPSAQARCTLSSCRVGAQAGA